MLKAASLSAAGAAASPFMAASEIGQQEPASHHHEPLSSFKYRIEASEARVTAGGSAREANITEFPISESMAGVSMRLKPGGLRELHWHAIAAEWAYVIEGNVRTTVISPNGETATDDFGPGDVWYFPKGHGHALQGLGPGEAHFILVFDDGNFSEFGTFSITDWLGHTAPDVVSRNVGLSAARVQELPRDEVYIAQGRVPPPIPQSLRNGEPIPAQSPHKFKLAAMKPVAFPGGEERIVTSKEFPIQTTLTGSIQHLRPGATREMHWHPNADEWQYYISGRARVGIFGAHGRVATEEFGPGEIAFIKHGFGHYVEQIGNEPTTILIVFNSPTYEQISLSTWLASNPANLIADNFQLSASEVDELPRHTAGILAK
jgi:oxalate decarboxylase